MDEVKRDRLHEVYPGEWNGVERHSLNCVQPKGQQRRLLAMDRQPKMVSHAAIDKTRHSLRNAQPLRGRLAKRSNSGGVRWQIARLEELHRARRKANRTVPAGIAEK